MKKSNLIMLSAGVLALSAAAFAAVPVIEKAQSLDSTKIRHLDGTISRAPQRAMSLPYLIQPTADQWGQCVTVDQNADGKTWSTTTQEGRLCFYYAYNTSQPGDDWAFLPSVTLTPGRYRVSSDYMTKNYPESYRIAIGTAADPAAMTQTIQDLENVQHPNTFEHVENEFEVETEGDYYVGLYCYSLADKFYLYVRDIAIEKLDPSKPKTPTIESINFSGQDGTISILAPDSKISGESLGSTPLSLNVLIDDAPVDGSPMSVSAGQVVELAMNLPRGMHTVSTYASYDDNGETKTSEITSQQFQVIKYIEIPMPLPAYMAPDEDDFTVCTVIDANNDNTKWEYTTTGFASDENISGAFRFAVGYTNSGNDWLILPAMQKGDSDSFEFAYRFTTKYDYESYQIYKATEPTVEAMLAGEQLLDESSARTDDKWVDKSVKFTHTGTETFYIGIHATSPMYRGFMYFANLEVKTFNSATPKKPEFSEFAFDGGDGNVIIQAPSQCFSGSEINASEVSVKLSIDGEEVSTQTCAPGATVTIPVTGLELGNHTFSATASYVYEGVTLTSDPQTATHMITRPSSYTYSIPVELNFKGSETGELSPVLTYETIIFDVNEDKKTWEKSITGLTYNFNGTKPADDWAIFAVPVVIEDASKTYQITVNARSSSSYPEAFSVHYGAGPTIEQMTTQVLDEPEYKENDAKDCVSTFTVPAPGRYYFGIHCYSDANMLSLYVNSLKIDIAPAANGPGLVDELTATPDPTGQLKANVAFTMPTLTRADEEMAADTQLTATVRSSVESKTVTGTPGQAVSTDIVTVNGANTISVVVENAEGRGEESTVDVRCGLDKPKAPVITSAKISEDGLGVILTWDPVTEGVNDGIVYNMMYRVSLYDEEDEDWYAQEHLAETTYEFRIPEGTPQDFYKLGVEAYTSPSTNSDLTQIEVAAGQPYTLDINEQFANNTFTYEPLYSLSTPDSYAIPSWSLDYATNYCPDAAIDGQKVFIGRVFYGSGDGGVMLPLVATTEATEVEFAIDVYSDSNITPTMNVFAQTFGTERMLVGALEPQTEPGWHTYTFTLPEEMLNRPWVQMCIFTQFANSSQYALIKGYKMTSIVSDGVTDLLAGKVSVLASRGNIAINGAEGKNITVSDLTGKVVYSAKGESNGIVIPAAAGVHIVRIDNKSYKVMVK